MGKKIFAVFELLLVTLYAAAVLSVSQEMIHLLLPHIEPVATTGVIIALILAAIGHNRSTGRNLLPVSWVTALSLTTFLAVEPTLSSTVPPLCILVIIISGIFAKRFAWIMPLSIFIFGIPVKNTILLLISQSPLEGAVIIPSSLLDPWPYIYFSAAAVISSLFSKSVLSHQKLHHPAILPNQLTARSSPTLPRISEPEYPTITEQLPLGLGSNSDEHEVADLLSSVVYFMSRNFKAYTAAGFIYDNTKQAFILNSSQSKSLVIKKNAVIPLGSGLVGKLGTEQKLFMSGDLRVYNLELKYYKEEEQINSILAAPIISDNELLGALVIDSRDKQMFKDQDRDIMKRFSTLAAALIKTEKMRFEQEKTAKISQLFYQASHQYTTALKSDEVIKILFSVVPGVITCTRQIFIEFDGENNRGRIAAVYGTSAPDGVIPGFEFPVNSGGLYAFASQKRKPITIADFQQYSDRYYRFTSDEPPNPAIRSLAIFPIMDDEQRCRGLYSVESDVPGLINEFTQQILTILMENTSVALVRAMLYQKMEKLATTDGLTGLNNHRTFQENLAQEIERSRRYNRPIALLLMDIDHFKTFNDTYGHPVGDLVLKEISACIKQSIRLNDIPARYGGEEFVVIVPETNERGSMITAERIRSTIEQHTIVSLGRELKVTVSIGCSAFPENAPSQQALIDTADKALYAAKKAGRNRAVPYKNGM